MESLGNKQVITVALEVVPCDDVYLDYSKTLTFRALIATCLAYI